MNRARKILLSVLVVGAVAAIAGVGSYSAFTATTANSGNQISSSTVSITDDDSGSALYSAGNLKPGASVSKCIEVEYTGSATSTVKMYTPSTIGSLGPYVDLKIEYGDGGNYSSCSGFVAQGTLFNNKLSVFGSTHNSWANGLENPNISDVNVWSNVYEPLSHVTMKVTATLVDDGSNNAMGLTTGSHSFTWEARSTT